MFPVDISPDMNMYSLLISQGYDPGSALCEFIDNSIHAFQEYSDKDRLEIVIKVYSSNYADKYLRNSIHIQDNGPGISRNMIKDAFKPAKPPSKKGLSEFGIGMKSSAVWFADKWKLETWPIGENIKLASTFDLTKILSEGGSQINVKESKATEGRHGTIIKLIDLRREIDKVKFNLIIRGIGDVYQRFINASPCKIAIRASYDDDQVGVKSVYKQFETLVAPKFIKKDKVIYQTGKDRTWKVDVDTFFEGKKVTGFVHLMQAGGYKKNPGLILFRHNRVICGTTDKHYQPVGIYSTSNKAAGLRLQGELDLDEHAVSYTKDLFTFDDDRFTELLLEVKGMKELVKQADNYRAKGADTLPSDEESIKGGVDPEPSTATAGSSSSSDLPSGDADFSKDENSDEGSSGLSLDKKKQTKIVPSKKIINGLNKLSSLKLTQLYGSLCVISLVEHPAIMYVGAWSFFETLSRLSGSSEKQSFPDYFSSKAILWGLTKSAKKSSQTVLKRISEIGNSTKHCQVAVPLDAMQLANDFEVLEDLIVKSIEAAFKCKNNHK